MTQVPATSRWIFRSRPHPAAQVRWYCFPFAGGAAHAFSQWSAYVASNVEIRAVQLPGRGPRLSEPLFERLEPLVEAVAAALTPEWAQGPFVLYGHSLGGIVVHELARRLRRTGGPKPLAVAISGRPAPSAMAKREALLSAATDEELWAELRRYNGTPNELLDDPEVKRFFLPIVRADFSIVDHFEFRPEPPLDIPLRIAIGVHDPSTPPGSETGWASETTADCVIRRYDGDHFFLKSHAAEFVRMLDADLQSLIGR